VTDAVNPGQSVSLYEYDQVNRLVKATATNWALQWTYDEFGNRLGKNRLEAAGYRLQAEAGRMREGIWSPA